MWAGENSTSKLEFLNYKIVKNTSAKTKEVKFRKGEDVFWGLKMLTWKSAVSRIIVETGETGAELNRVPAN